MTRSNDALLARKSSSIWLIAQPHLWTLNLLQFIGQDAFIALLQSADNPAVFGKACVVLRSKADGTYKLVSYGMSLITSQRWRSRSVNRRYRIDISDAVELQSAHGRKSARFRTMKESVHA